MVRHGFSRISRRMVFTLTDVGSRRTGGVSVARAGLPPALYRETPDYTPRRTRVFA